MSKAPRWEPAVDQFDGAFALTDPAEASIALLQHVESKQHAMMSQWGGPACTVACSILENVTRGLHVRVPSGCKTMSLGLVVSGVGSATITSDTDATGSTLAWNVPGEDVPANAAIIWGSGPNAGAAAATGRAIDVSSAASWRWENEMLTVASSGAAGMDGTIWAVVVMPVFAAV